MKSAIRPPAVSGRFYPGDADTLKRSVDAMLREAAERSSPLPAPPAATAPPGLKVLAVVVPHAGYVYSGRVAAAAFERLRQAAPDTIVLVGPDHYVGFPGVALYPEGAFVTPLGPVAVDDVLAGALARTGGPLDAHPEFHAREHSLEVQVPFLQTVCPSARIVPILVGHRAAGDIDRLADALARETAGRNVVLLASTDLSHYHSRHEARLLDEQVLEAVSAVDADRLERVLATGVGEACGGAPLLAVLKAAVKLGADAAEVVAYADSGDVSGDTEAVVGYMAAVIGKRLPARQSPPPLSPAERERLLRLARASAAEAVGAGAVEPGLAAPIPVPPGAVGGVFVTLRHDRRLRGCIGVLRDVNDLAAAVARAARCSATEDPRFASIEARELGELSVEISVLGPFIECGPDEIVVGRHGLLVESPPFRGLLLPQVAVEQMWDRERFLSETCRKAGLAEGAWRGPVTLRRFEAQVFREEPGR